MARIEHDKIEKVEKNCRVHDAVKGQYIIFLDDAGNKYFQIETLGSEDRKIKGQSSQKIQFDAKTAEELVKILVQEFGIEIQ